MKESLIEALSAFGNALREGAWEIADLGQALADIMNGINHDRKTKWSAIVKEMGPEFDWDTLYVYICGHGELFDERWRKIMLSVAMGTRGLSKQYLLGDEGYEEEEEVKSVRSSDLEERQYSGPKQKHDEWIGGELAEWRRWKDDFLDLAEEFNYDNRVGLRRLKKYKSKTRIIGGTKKLSTITQGKLTVESYYAR